MANITGYISETEKRDHYLKCWKNFCEEAKITEEDPEYSFMKILLSEMDDIEIRKARYKSNYNKEQLIVILFAFLSSVISGLVSFADNEIFRKILGFMGIFVGASIAAVNSCTLWKSTKETWLRCSSYRAKLVLETDAFCDGTGKYGEIEGVRNKINLFKENINILRKEDYSNFFINMGSNFS